ncbi:MAG: phospholipase A [Gammaproteobacteria bacterium]
MKFKLLPFLLITLMSTNIYSATQYQRSKAHHHHKHYRPAPVVVIPQQPNPVLERARIEDTIPNYFGVAFYKPTYALPFYYTGSPDNKVYHNHTPNNERLKHLEFKYQVSIKVPIWKDMFHHPSSIYFAYTQQSYWQVYNHKNFIRETDYEPEFFLQNKLNRCLIRDWRIDFLNFGAVHQSNGYGTSQERSWNRLYLEAITNAGNWMISFKPWVVISKNDNNNNIANYLGYGRFLVAYKYHQHVFSLQAHNLIEGGARHATGELTWSFPVTCYLKGYVQVFSGYGQSLIEYNKRTNSAGIGLALNDWI